ncbi:MAG: hypothetical protein GXY42_01130 [Desulfovibrionales bacterium]|nr:hypothetical protein [Desulfovibrionales bacterium]
MELCFVCPIKGRFFYSALWEVNEMLAVREGQGGSRYLEGSVRVSCPLCNGEHVFGPDELLCPLSVREQDREHGANSKGGE